MTNQLQLTVAANYPVSVGANDQDTDPSLPQNPPFFYNDGQRIISGIDYHLVDTISRYLNLSYQFQHSYWEWGKQVNGSWTGMIGRIVNGSSDIALGVLTADPDRVKVVDFTIPYFYSPITFVMRLNKKSSLTARSLLIEPMSAEVWIALLSTIVFCALIMRIFRQQVNKTVQIAVRSLLNQGTPLIPVHLRLYLGLWLLCGLVLSHSYVALLFLFMSELIPRPDISSIEELALAVRDGHYIPSTSADGSIFKFIQELQSPPFNSIGKALIPINKTILALELMMTTNPRLVFICPRPLMKGRVASLGSQHFHIAPEGEETNFLTEQYVIAVTKNSIDLKDRINKIIRRLESSAHVYHWERVSMRENNRFYNNSNQTVSQSNPLCKGLPLNTVKYILYLLLLGLMISLGFFGCEMQFESFLNSLLISNIRQQLASTVAVSKVNGLPEPELNIFRRISNVLHFSDIHMPHIHHEHRRPSSPDHYDL